MREASIQASEAPAPPKLSAWQRWARHPQSLWFRKALFQVHLWVGVGIAIYVLVISVSGSAIVFRRELMHRSLRHTLSVTGSGPLLTDDELARSAQRAHPDYTVDNVGSRDDPNRPVEVVLEKDDRRIERLFDPYTGKDLGDPEPLINRAVGWLVDLHDNLLAGQAGRLLNGIGSCLVTILGITGTVLWWPGTKNWRRSTTIYWGAHFPRFNWDLHSATGFWFSLFVLVWGISGIYFCIPVAFTPLAGGAFLYWMGQLHIGRFSVVTEAAWTIFGLAPAVLAVSGALMWWNRVLRKKFRPVK